jgi:hypothetical protein
VTGHVYDGQTCNGVGQLVIKITPPTKSKSQAILVTNTDANGDFQLQIPEAGNYYVSVFEGLTEVYGKVASFDGQRPLYIALQHTASSQTASTSQGCVQFAQLKQLTPEAIAISADNYLYVLDVHGLILRYSAAQTGASPLVIATLGSSNQVFDMALGQSNGQSHLFVSVIQGNAGQVMRYSVAGIFEGNWFQYPPLGALSTDDQKHLVYISVLSTGQLYSQNFSDQQLGQPLFRFSEASGLSPLAVDVQTQTIYAGDVAKHVVYSLDLGSKTSRMVAEDIGTPAAMIVNPISKELIIADGSGAAVWTLSLSPSVGKPALFVRGKPLKQPSGVAVARDGSIWVADQGAHAIFHYSRSHQLLATIR